MQIDSDELGVTGSTWLYLAFVGGSRVSGFAKYHLCMEKMLKPCLPRSVWALEKFTCAT